ncbi:hypothetical protein CEXT_25311 [Caerostris extrusa]|uniref:Uncharacterized protein n=1 Tax=Caerostris extrusa TaxID=172846 RepID=A0AAV4T856_CAEEX|nr:hypothetical protein CEXT_25311 [Caerostris extrusa]
MSVPNKEKVRDKFREMDKLFIVQSKEIVELKAELKLATRGKCVVVDSSYDTNTTDLQIAKLEGKLEESRSMLENIIEDNRQLKNKIEEQKKTKPTVNQHQHSNTYADKLKIRKETPTLIIRPTEGSCSGKELQQIISKNLRNTQEAAAVQQVYIKKNLSSKQKEQLKKLHEKINTTAKIDQVARVIQPQQKTQSLIIYGDINKEQIIVAIQKTILNEKAEINIEKCDFYSINVNKRMDLIKNSICFL